MSFTSDLNAAVSRPTPPSVSLNPAGPSGLWIPDAHLFTDADLHHLALGVAREGRRPQLLQPRCDGEQLAG